MKHLSHLSLVRSCEANTEPVQRKTGIFTRQEALDRGLLIDVTAFAQRQLSYPCEIAISQLVYDRFVHWNGRDNLLQVHQDQATRLLSLLIVAKTVVYQKDACGQTLQFMFSAIPRNGYAVSKVAQPLKLVLGYSEQQFPVLTLFGEHDRANLLTSTLSFDMRGAL